MGWQAISNFGKIGKGTSFHFVESPTIPGYPAAPFKLNSEIPVELAGGERTKAKIVGANSGELHLQFPDGKIWQLTPHSEKDFPVGINSPGLNSQDWVVRAEVKGDTPPD